MMTYSSGLQIVMPQGLLAAASGDMDPLVQQLHDNMTALRTASDSFRAQNMAFFQEYGWQGAGALIMGTILAAILIVWFVSRLFTKIASGFGPTCVYLFVSSGMAIMMSIFTAVGVAISYGILGSVPATVVIVGIGFLMTLYFGGIWPWQRIFDLNFNQGVAALLAVLALNVLAHYGATLALQPMYQQALANHPATQPVGEPAAPAVVAAAAVPTVTPTITAASVPASVPVSVAAAVIVPQPPVAIVTMAGSAPVNPQALRAEVHRLYTELSRMRTTLDTNNASAVREFNQKAAIYTDLKREADAAQKASQNATVTPASGVAPISASAGGVPTT